MNIYEVLKKGNVNAFNIVLERNDILIGVSKTKGKWPYPIFSKHPKDEILIVVNGKVRVEYENGKKVLLKKGDIEVMKAGLGHKVHNSQSKPSETILIFP